MSKHLNNNKKTIGKIFKACRSNAKTKNRWAVRDGTAIPIVVKNCQIPTSPNPKRPKPPKR